MNEDLKTEVALINQRLNSGAATFGWLRAAVVGALLSSVGAAAGMVYQVGRTSAQRDQMAEQIAELRMRASKSEEAHEAARIRLESLSTVARSEQDRRAALESLVQAMAGKRRR